MAIDPTPPTQGTHRTRSAIIVEAPRFTVTGPATFNAPDAAALLAVLPDSERLPELRRLVEFGAQAVESVRASTTLRLVEAQLAGLGDNLAITLTGLLTKDRGTALREVRDLLDDHRARVTTSMTKYLDPESQASLPATMGKLYEKAIADFYNRAEALLAAEGDDSALGKLAARFSKDLDKATATIMEQVAARHALSTRSNLAGRPFEDALEERLITIARPLGDKVERTGDTLGQLLRRWGDILYHINRDQLRGHDCRILLEAKKRAENASGFKLPAIRDVLVQSCRNREAQAGIFVVDSATLLPLGLGFHEVDSTSLAVVYEPGGDDLALTIAIRLLRAGIVADVTSAGGDTIDVEGVRQALADVRVSLGKLEDVRKQHQAAANAIGRASASATDLADGVLSALTRLERLLQP